jgi:hypothetical protein
MTGYLVKVELSFECFILEPGFQELRLDRIAWLTPLVDTCFSNVAALVYYEFLLFLFSLMKKETKNQGCWVDF